MRQANVVSITSAGRRPQQRVPVPASIFEGRPEPSFVLFDPRGRMISPAEARTVYVSPGDLPALDTYVYTHLRALGADQYIAPTDRAWILQRVVLHEAREALGLRRGYQPRSLISVSKQVASFAQASSGRFSYLPPGVDDGPAEIATNRALYAVALGSNGGLADPAGAERAAHGGDLRRRREHDGRSGAARDRRAPERGSVANRPRAP